MIKYLAHVFTLDLPPAEKWLLAAMADNADEYGLCWPSKRTLGWKTGYSGSQVRRLWRRLEARGLLVKVKEATPVGTARWRLSFAKAKAARRHSAQRHCPQILRREVLRAFDATCQYCGRQGNPVADPDNRHWSIDRIVPARLGGDYEPGNVTLACFRCNSQKRDRSVAAEPLDHRLEARSETGVLEQLHVALLSRGRKMDPQPGAQDGPALAQDGPPGGAIEPPTGAPDGPRTVSEPSTEPGIVIPTKGRIRLVRRHHA